MSSARSIDSKSVQRLEGSVRPRVRLLPRPQLNQSPAARNGDRHTNPLPGLDGPGNLLVNDVHSRLNATTVKRLFRPRSLAQLAKLVKSAGEQKLSLSIAGARHAMGGQQFLQHGLLIDMRGMNGVLEFDAVRGTVTVQAGICWPELLRELERIQENHFRWTFRQKQTGADGLSIGGALSANIHGRGLTFKPFVQDILSFEIVTAEGSLRHCSREWNSQLFRLAIGGYGLFGVVYAVTLQLVPRQKLERVVEVIGVDQLMDGFRQRIDSGFLYGDFQFAIDPASDDFLNRGVFSCYRPVAEHTQIPASQKKLTTADWERLLYLAHAEKTRAFQEYTAFYQTTNGQIYWSDAHQLSHYPEGYHTAVDQKLACCPGSEMITEIYVPRAKLCDYLDQVRDAARKNGWNIIYGTIRLIERDDETFLPWAREPWVCIIFNLCVRHSDQGLQAARQTFRHLIDLAIQFDGSYYLTYHKWAAPAQLERCHPQIWNFFERKRAYDPDEIFSSNWYTHYRNFALANGRAKSSAEAAL